MNHPDREYAPPRVDVIEGIRVVRDDLIPGGTKARVIPILFDDKHDEYVYAGPCQGYAQVALAYCCREYGLHATLFCAKRNERHARILEAIVAGAKVVEVSNGYLSVVKHKADTYCIENRNALMLPFGLDTPAIRGAIADVARMIDDPPSEVWTVAGSGTLSMALQQAWPSAVFNAVQIGRVLGDYVGRAKVWVAPEKFETGAKEPPPFPSCDNYDAKAWRFIKQYAKPGTLFWNVAA